MQGTWNPWHGCIRYSEGCANCYVYRRDDSFGKDASEIRRTKEYDILTRKKADGSYLFLPDGGCTLTCMTSDFFLAEADAWREHIWNDIRTRSDIFFTIFTKRILRVGSCLPADWGNGYANVRLLCTVETQRRADERLPVFLELPAKHKGIVCEPLLEAIDLFRYLGPQIDSVSVGGESGPGARACDYSWVLSLRDQCADAGVSFHYHQTGAALLKDGKLYRIPRRLQELQARKAGIDL